MHRMSKAVATLNNLVSGTGGAAGLLCALLLPILWPTASTASDIITETVAGTVVVPSATPPAISEVTPNQPPAPPAPSVFSVLSAEDRALYRDIFALQDEAKWKQADRLIKQLQDDLLMGHVLSQRYMHPTGYRSNFRELSGWMKKYADHPGASRLYRLALKRRGGGAAKPRRPVPLNGNTGDSTKTKNTLRSRLSKDQRAAVKSLESRIRREVRRGNPERAERYLWAFERQGIYSAAEFDRWLGVVAISHYHNGNDDKALALASYAASRSRDSNAQPDWVAGLAAWRLGACDKAAGYFENVAAAKKASDWMHSAGAFWAARSELRCQRPEKVASLLREAASHGETFYGLLAARQLGLKQRFDWGLPDLSAADYAELSVLPGVRRAVALAEIDEYKLADDETRLVWGRQGQKIWRPLVALAARLKLPATQLSLSRQAPNGETSGMAVKYPMPSWQPEGGFKVDRAIMFALMRQESAFKPRARSYVGAMGLMQVMPATASFLERDRSLRWSNRWKLYEPEFNLRLSQDNIQMLMGYEITEGNLFKFATAYNGGPGNLSRWDKKMKYGSDPLLYIESVPAPETRNFIEKILANMWIYRNRMGQPSPSLDAVASGAWPPFESLDGEDDATQKPEAKAKAHIEAGAVQHAGK